MPGQFDQQVQFPIAGVAQLLADRNVKEAEMKAKQQAQLVEGLKLFGGGVQSLVDQRQKMAQALTQADILMKNPEIMAQMDSQVGTMTPPVRPVANVAASPMPVSLGQTATPDASGMPVPNVPAQPVMASSIPANMELMRQKFASALQGTKGDDFLKFLRPQEINLINQQLGKSGEILNTTTIKAPKGSKLITEGPQAVPQRQSPLMSPDRAEFKIIDTFNANPQVRKQQQSLDGASAVRELALSGNPIAAAAIPTYMARASGEVGNLSEPDKAPFGGSRAILERMEASLNQLSKGQLTEENKNFLIDLSDIMSRNAEKNLDRKAREMAKQYGSGRIGFKPEEIFKSLRPDSQYKEPDPESKDVLKVGGTFHGEEITGVKLLNP